MTETRQDDEYTREVEDRLTLHSAVLAAIDNLTRRQLQVLLLWLALDVPMPKIASVLCITERTVRTHKKNALKRIKDVYTAMLEEKQDV